MIKLKLNDNLVELQTHDTEKGQMYKAQDLLEGVNYNKDSARRKVDNWKRHEESNYVNFTSLKDEGSNYVNITPLNKKGRYGGTYLYKTDLLKLAAYVDKSFYDTVFEAFEAAASGDAKAAIDIATSVAIPQELIDREKRLRDKMNSLIEELTDDTRKRTNLFTNFNRLISKAVSGYTPKELTDGLPTFKFICEQGHVGGVSAYLATIETIIMGLGAGLDYQMIALMLQVETTKNKKQLKQLKVV